MSYHDNIQEVARAIETARQKTYNPDGKTIAWTEREEHHIHIIIGKILRLQYFMKDLDKAKDEIVDIYNHAALLFEEVGKRGKSN